MVLIQRVSGYEQQPARFFDPADNCGLSFIGGRSNYLVSGTSRVTCEAFADATSGNYSLDIGKQ